MPWTTTVFEKTKASASGDSTVRVGGVRSTQTVVSSPPVKPTWSVAVAVRTTSPSVGREMTRSKRPATGTVGSPFTTGVTGEASCVAHLGGPE